MRLFHLSKSRLGKILIFLAITVSAALGFVVGYLARPQVKDIESGQGSKPTLSSLLEKVRVIEVIDGDTVRLEDGRVVRYLGIDTPETNEYYYREAKERNRELVENMVVELQRGSRNIDEYGRLLRYVFLDGTFVNAELVAEGCARAYIFDPEDRYSQVLVQLEQYAKMRKMGLWKSE